MDGNGTTMLWQRLVEELADVFDAHGVCAAAAAEIARYTQTTTVVGISDPVRKHYDVWISQGDSLLTQTRWDSDKASFASLMDTGRAVLQPKHNLAANELVKSELWQLPRETVLAVPLPFPPG
ncbi:MAG: hypothetical protein L0322_07265, partial [Chloroflexi bacterium]|nr:hypothetical protein [Chloroflexota bacterium]